MEKVERLDRVAIIAITKDGFRTAVKLANGMPADIFISERLTETFFTEKSGIPKGFSIEIMDDGFMANAERIFKSYEEIVLLMACGIAVRGFGPLAVDKTSDPAVVVADERGVFAISFLSGHLGGANRLAKEVAALTGGTPVITTASDLKGFIAVDTLSEKANWHMNDIHTAGRVTADLVDGIKPEILIEKEAMALLSDELVEEILTGGYSLTELQPSTGVSQAKALIYVGWEKTQIYEDFTGEKTWVTPRDLVLGIGCKKGMDKLTIEKAYETVLKKAKVKKERIGIIATIGLKAEEPGIREFAKQENLRITIIPEEEIVKVESLFPGSDFVKQTVGVASVAEPCAYLASKEGTMVIDRQAEDGVTMAIYRVKA